MMLMYQLYPQEYSCRVEMIPYEIMHLVEELDRNIGTDLLHLLVNVVVVVAVFVV